MVKQAGGETSLIGAATAGDDDAFRRLVEPIRGELHLHCYRMLGSFHDAEDVLQDAQLKAWRSLRTFDGRASFRTWMFRVATNTCLDALRTRRRRVLPQDISDARDPTLGLGDQRHDIPWLEPYPDAICRPWIRGDGRAAGERATGIHPGTTDSSTPATSGADIAMSPRLDRSRSCLGNRDVGGGRQ